MKVDRTVYSPTTRYLIYFECTSTRRGKAKGCILLRLFRLFLVYLTSGFFFSYFEKEKPGQDSRSLHSMSFRKPVSYTHPRGSVREECGSIAKRRERWRGAQKRARERPGSRYKFSLRKLMSAAAPFLSRPNPNIPGIYLREGTFHVSVVKPRIFLEDFR